MSKSIGLALLLAFQVLHLEAKSDALEGRAPSLTARVIRVGTGDPSDCEWDYDDFPNWAKCSYTCGYKSNQENGSPINIDTSSDKITSQTFELSTPSGENLESSSYRTLWNSGDLSGKWSREGFAFQLTIDDTLDDTKVPTIKYDTDGVLTGNDGYEYKLRFVEYHWGKDATEGSEHTIDNVQDAVEVHYVHENTHASLSDDDADKYLVIAVLYEKVDIEDDETNWIKKPANFARKIAIDELKSSDSDSDGNPLNDSSELISIVKDMHGYLWKTLKTALKEGHYAYKGSLTVPGCNEQVTWIVAKKKLKVYGPHLAFFRKLTFPRTGAQIRKNWRPTQELGDRTVYDMNTSWDD